MTKIRCTVPSSFSHVVVLRLASGKHRPVDTERYRYDQPRSDATDNRSMSNQKKSIQFALAALPFMKGVRGRLIVSG
jgi:hypothetical protein